MLATMMLMVAQRAAEGTPKQDSEPQELPKGSQESPKRHRGAIKSTRSEADRAPKSNQKEAKTAIESEGKMCQKNPG